MNRSKLVFVVINALLLVVILTWLHSKAEADSLGQLATSGAGNFMPGSTTSAPTGNNANNQPSGLPTQCVANNNKLDPYSCSNPLGVFGPNSVSNGSNSPYVINQQVNKNANSNNQAPSAGQSPQPSNYSAPINYQAPVNYKAPVNYGQSPNTKANQDDN